jgi:hypothetical protein
MNDTKTTVEKFFDRYAAALLARDEWTMGQLYAVPALILFPGNSLVVSDGAQTERFFASSWAQYDGVDAVTKHTNVMAEAPGTVWADVTWSYDGQPRERFCYQLVGSGDEQHIAVLTPMSLSSRTA